MLNTTGGGFAKGNGDGIGGLIVSSPEPRVWPRVPRLAGGMPRLTGAAAPVAVGEAVATGAASATAPGAGSAVVAALPPTEAILGAAALPEASLSGEPPATLPTIFGPPTFGPTPLGKATLLGEALEPSPPETGPPGVLPVVELPPGVLPVVELPPGVTNDRPRLVPSEPIGAGAAVTPGEITGEGLGSGDAVAITAGPGVGLNGLPPDALPDGGSTGA
jgi:hypothetical protein